MADSNTHLEALRGLATETEWLEFKEAKNSFSVDDLGRYVSALANEANFLGRDAGWLVFGVKNAVDASTGLRPVVGSRFATTAMERNEIKRQIAGHTSPSLGLNDPLDDLPLLLGLDALVARLRIIQVHLLPPRQTAPLNLPNYDDWVIREALHNCIAHQDYSLGGRIRVTENPDTLVFFNLGAFLPGSVAKLLAARQPEQRYRNACLANAMVELDLMETLNRGVRDMFRIQRERFFPLPDYDFGEQPASVGVTLYGRTLDERYVQTLMAHAELTLEDALLLDKVQKGVSITAEQTRHLRALQLVEGRSPKLRISAQVAVATGQEVAYLNQQRPDVSDYKAALCKLLTLGPQPRTKVDDLLLPKLQLWIPELARRKEYVKALLKEMSKEGRIQNIGGRTKAALWAMAPNTPKQK